MSQDVYILGGNQTDFALNWKKKGRDLPTMMSESIQAALAEAKVDAAAVQGAHVGNFAGELYCRQGHLGAFFCQADSAFVGLPTARHEAACASGSIAMLAALAELQAGWRELLCVVGVEQMKTVSPKEGGDFLGTAAWYEREAAGIDFAFPKLFGSLGDEYDRRFGLKSEHLDAIAALNYNNGRRNPLAQTRAWDTSAATIADKGGEKNRQIAGRIHVSDCSQITDGVATLLVCSSDYARCYANKTGRELSSIPRVKGWGHHTAPLLFADKLAASEGQPFVLPQVRQSISDALTMAKMADVTAVDGIETHDCFTTSEYMAIDHFGITAPGESWKAIEQGWLEIGGKHPINPSGGLIGAGHPVGATGVRQCLDCYKQVTEQAGDYQVPGARNFATLNIGGSGTTSVSFIIGVDR